MKWYHLTLLFVAYLVSAGAIEVPKAAFSPFDSPDFCSQNITPTCNTTFSYIDELNKQIRPLVIKLTETPFFRHFKLDLDKQCKFWNAKHFCSTSNCAVEILPASQYNWSDITIDALKPSKLGEIHRSRATDVGNSSESETCEDTDYTYLDDDEHRCVYVNLIDNPERFTGYGGNQSLAVWKAIYSENCFPNTNPMSMVPGGEPEQCVEKNLFYRLISGMHASISVHLSNEYLAPNGDFYPNLKTFMERVGKFNDRLSNIYFNFALVSEAIVRLSKIINIVDFIDHDAVAANQLNQFNEEAPDYKHLLNGIISALKSNTFLKTGTLFDPAQSPPGLKNEFRSRFKNVSAIMDCVGCDRCRMWGKLQTIGYGTASKILFESEDKNLDRLLFRKIEFVALFNTFDRLSKSVEAIENFKAMYVRHLEDVHKGLAKPGDYEVNGQNEGLEFPFFNAKFSDDETEKKPIRRKQPPRKGQSAEAAKKKVVEESLSQEPHGFVDEIKLALQEVTDALIFVWHSYLDFPITVYKIGIVYLSSIWDAFIGKPKAYEYENEFQLHDKDNIEDYIRLHN